MIDNRKKIHNHRKSGGGGGYGSHRNAKTFDHNQNKWNTKKVWKDKDDECVKYGQKNERGSLELTPTI